VALRAEGFHVEPVETAVHLSQEMLHRKLKARVILVERIGFGPRGTRKEEKREPEQSEVKCHEPKNATNEDGMSQRDWRVPGVKSGLRN
jgi:hypothetical protein